MIIRRETATAVPCEPIGIAVDHIGVVVRDLGREVAAWRQQGFTVSEPVALVGPTADGGTMRLGQESAHVVFENAYVELSSPVLGCGNHLEPYLDRYGDGVRILVLSTPDADAAHVTIAATWPATTEVKSAERAVTIGSTLQTARFRWFALSRDVVPGVLSAVVQHLTPEIVFHPSLVDHGNRFRRVSHILVRGRRDDLALPLGAFGTTAGLAQLVLEPSGRPTSISAISLISAAGGPESVFALGGHP